MEFKNADGKAIVLSLVKAIQDNKDYLSEVDGLIGDGDHGVNMNKGFTICGEKLKETEADFSTALKILGRILMVEIGGSMGPLYGTFFSEMSKVTANKEKVDQALFADMLDAAYAGIKKIGNAQVGDKTLVDTIDPAVKAYKDACESGKDFKSSLEDMKTAAITGRDSTVGLIARIGRASRLGERSKGVLDAGATSCCLLLCTMADAVEELIR